MTDHDVIDVIDETTADDGTPFRVILALDEDSADLDPRGNYGNVGRIVALDAPGGSKWRPREDDPGENGRYGNANAPSIVDAVQDHSFPVVSRWLRIFHGAGVVLPLYESADGLTTGDPDDTAGPGDYRGVIFDTPTTRKHGGWPERVEYSTTREHLRIALEAEVDEWATWARGEVFGWVIQRGELDEDGKTVWDEDSNEDASWGFIGEDWAREASRIALDDFICAYDTANPASDDPAENEDDELAYAETAGVLPEAVLAR